MKRSDVLITDIFRSQLGRKLLCPDDMKNIDQHGIKMDIPEGTETVTFLWEHKIDSSKSIPSITMGYHHWPIDKLHELENQFYFVKFTHPEVIDFAIPILRAYVGDDAIPIDTIIQ